MTNVKEQPTTEMFQYFKHGTGGAAIAAKMIAEGKTVSFDIWKRIKDESGFLTMRREFVKTVFIGLCKSEDEPEGRNIALMISHCSDLDAHQSHSIIASWNGCNIANDPVFISAAIVGYMCSDKAENYFLNEA